MAVHARDEKAIFLAALEQPGTSERDAYIREVCSGDTELLQRVKLLLSLHQQSQGPLDAPPPGVGGSPTLDLPPSETCGTSIGPYKLMEQIGEGGMGLVFVAEQQQPVRRKVALKVIKPGMDTRQVVARFEAERQALALMDHPNIAKVLDGGETASGRPYFVMELVKGVPITEYCDQNQVPVHERLELFHHVCQAVQHAHQKGIIHRDIKPSNVLVMSHDGTPMIKVIDFGVAKAIGQQLTDKTIYTQFTHMVGTPLYMSPEQAGQSGVDVDTRTDIYALGVLLYELLTGTTPFDKERLREADFDEIRRIIREEEPPRPSTRISTLGQAATTVSANRKSEPKQLSRLFRGELDWIVMRALEKDRNRRYESASAFAADVQHYLHDEPVQACPPSAWYRFRKFARRNKSALAIAGLVLLLIAVLGGALGWVVRDQEARHAKVANELELALGRAELFQGQGKRAEALAAFERAALLAGELTRDAAREKRLADLKERLDLEALDQQFLMDFAEIRLRAQSRVDVGDGRFAPEAAYPEIDKALHRYGIEIGVTPVQQAAARVKGRPEPVRQQLLAALDECLSQAPQKDAQARQWLLATLTAADQDSWRLRVRKALLEHDWPALEPLARAADVPNQPPNFLLIVARALPLQMKTSRLELFRKIQDAYPADLWANHLLGDELQSNNRPSEAIRYYTAAIALLPRNPGIYVNRGIALKDAGELRAAIRDYRHALALAPQYNKVHYNLALALARNREFDEAIVEYRAYFRGEPGDAVAHYNFGFALRAADHLDEAIVEYRKAISLKKDFASAHFNLGQALGARGELDLAISELSQAVHYNPDDALNHYGLGNALFIKGRLDKAIAEYREALRIKPEYAEVRQSLERAEQLLGLDTRLPGVLQGKDRAKHAGESLGFAILCMPPYREQYADAARFYGEAFAAEPKLAESLQAPHRYNAACAAALAGCGRGTKADKLDATRKAQLRRQSLNWLRADLEARRLLLDNDARKAAPYVTEQMRHWLADTDFAGVRGPQALAKLPEAERQPWRNLWSDVAGLLKRAQEKLGPGKQ
jgi:serine/threonine protein kinase/Flp pilus assembly protein TadD